MGPINFPIPRSVYQQTPEARQTAAANAGVVPVGQKSTIPNKLPQAAPTNALPSWASQSNLINQLVGGAGGDLAANPTVGTQTTAPNVAVPNDARKTQTPDFRTNQADAGSKLAGGGGAFRTARVSSAALANVAPALADSPDLNMDVAEAETGQTEEQKAAARAATRGDRGTPGTEQTEEQRAAAEAAARAATRGDRGSAGSTEEYESDANNQSGSSSSGLLAARDKDGNLIDYDKDPADDTHETAGVDGVIVGAGTFSREQLQEFADLNGFSLSEATKIFATFAAQLPAHHRGSTINHVEANGDGSFKVWFKHPNSPGESYVDMSSDMIEKARKEDAREADIEATAQANSDRDLALAELRKLAETEAPGMDPQVIQDLLTASDSRRSLEQSKAISLAMRLGQDPETMQAQSAGINQEFGVAGMEEASKIKMQAEVQNLQSAMREYDAKLSAINQSAALFAGSAQAQEMAKIQSSLLAKRAAAERDMMKYQMQLQQQQSPGFGEILGGIGLGILGGGLNALTGGIFGGMENALSTKLWG